MKHSYVVGTGWFCSDKPRPEASDKHPWTDTPEFHELWKDLVYRYAAPEALVAVGGCSPLRPYPDERELYVELGKPFWPPGGDNFPCALVRAMVVGMNYAWSRGCDYIFLEQDTLVVGDGWVDRMYECLYEADEFGNAIVLPSSKWKGNKVGHRIQSSLFLVPNALLPAYSKAMTETRESLVERQLPTAAEDIGAERCRLSFGVGRIRPIDWNDQHLYVHQMSREEMMKLGEREGCAPGIKAAMDAYDTEYGVLERVTRSEKRAYEKEDIAQSCHRPQTGRSSLQLQYSPQRQCAAVQTTQNEQR